MTTVKNSLLFILANKYIIQAMPLLKLTDLGVNSGKMVGLEGIEPLTCLLN